jgi:hypothetical protein
MGAPNSDLFKAKKANSQQKIEIEMLRKHIAKLNLDLQLIKLALEAVKQELRVAKTIKRKPVKESRPKVTTNDDS